MYIPLKHRHRILTANQLQQAGRNPQGRNPRPSAETLPDFPTPSKTVHSEPPISHPEREIGESDPEENVETFHVDDPAFTDLLLRREIFV